MTTADRLVVDELAARVTVLEHDVVIYRLLFRASLAEAVITIHERDSLRRQLAALRDEYRDFRERVLRDAGVAA